MYSLPLKLYEVVSEQNVAQINAKGVAGLIRDFSLRREFRYLTQDSRDKMRYKMYI